MLAAAVIEATGISKSYAQGQNIRPVFDAFSFSLRRGECVAILGQNGSGKTTFLNLVAGSVLPDQGRLAVLGHPPGEQPVGYVFQDYRATLMPWYTVIDNILLPGDLRGQIRAEARSKVEQLVHDMGLTDRLPLDAYPYELSGGQQQITCLLRAFFYSAALLLLDEPTSAIDSQMRWEVWRVIRLFRERANPGIVVVTHDIDESLILGDRIIYLGGSPAQVMLEEVNYTPETRSLRSLGSPEANNLRTIILEAWSKSTSEAAASSRDQKP